MAEGWRVLLALGATAIVAGGVVPSLEVEVKQL